MDQPIITVENLSKAYLLGKEQKSDTLMQAVAGTLRAPMRNLRQLRRLDTFDVSQDDQAADTDVLWALRDVTFEVMRGEVLGIIGRNGAGKSTLLKLLARIAHPTHGRAELRGRVSALLEVGTGFHPELTGRENVYMNGTILGMRKAEIDAKFDKIVEFSGVERFLDTPVKRYSSGMQVRLAFSVAAHLDPEILIVDEVLAVGDAEFQRRCLGRMKEVAKGGDRTVLFVSHNMPSVRNLCSRALLLRNGRVERTGAPVEVTQAYLDGQRGSNSVSLGVYEVEGKVVRRVEILGASGAPTPRLVTGEPCAFQLWIYCAEPIKHPTFGVGISDDEGRRLFTQVSNICNFEPRQVAGAVVVKCHIPRLRLLPGRYLVKVAVGSRTGAEIDSLDAVASFEVVAGDFFGTGRMPSSSQGVFADEAEWAMRPARQGVGNLEPRDSERDE